MKTTEPNLYVGFDPNEIAAYKVCIQSIRTANRDEAYDLNIKCLTSRTIPGWERPPEKLQSTDFTYTRFAIPSLEDYKGVSLYCDSDFLWRKSPRPIIDLWFDKKYAVMVVKHPQYIPNETKMGGIPQSGPWPKKNWASLILWNNEHPANKWLTPKTIAKVVPGKKLHEFFWLEEDEIGSLCLDFNCLAGYYDMNDPWGIHFTDGVPLHPNHQETTYSDMWRSVLNEASLP